MSSGGLRLGHVELREMLNCANVSVRKPAGNTNTSTSALRVLSWTSSPMMHCTSVFIATGVMTMLLRAGSRRRDTSFIG